MSACPSDYVKSSFPLDIQRQLSPRQLRTRNVFHRHELEAEENALPPPDDRIRRRCLRARARGEWRNGAGKRRWLRRLRQWRKVLIGRVQALQCIRWRASRQEAIGWPKGPEVIRWFKVAIRWLEVIVGRLTVINEVVIEWFEDVISWSKVDIGIALTGLVNFAFTI